MTQTNQQPGLDSLSKSFDPAQVEAQWGKVWESMGIGRAGHRGTGEPQAGAPAFAIQLPPPNVTGSLHMGHGFNNAVMDCLIRWRRMQGRNTLWQPGTDHAGIATQNVVEKTLHKEGKTRHDLGREKFVERVWEWKRQYGGVIVRQLRTLGCSCDWEREKFTMDDTLSAAVREVFEETGIAIGADPVPLAHLRDWQLSNVYTIYPAWRQRYAPGVTQNTEHVFGLCVPEGTAVTLAPREHLRYRWLPWREAADLCFSPSNTEAILLLPRYHQPEVMSAL